MPGPDNKSAGDTVAFTVTAEIVATYESGRMKVRWHSGEEIVHPSDVRVQS